MCIILALRRWKKKHIVVGDKDNEENLTAGYKVMAVFRFSALVVVIVASTIAAVMVSAGVDVNIVGRQPTDSSAHDRAFQQHDCLVRAQPRPSCGDHGIHRFCRDVRGRKSLRQRRQPGTEPRARGHRRRQHCRCVFQPIPVAGSFRRTAVNASAGSKSSMSNVLTGLGVMLILLLLSPIITFVPYSALAAIIITSVTKLINIDAFMLAWKVSRADFYVLVTTLVATLSLGIEIGIAVGTVFSILNIIRESASPHIAILGRANVAKEKGEEEKLQWRDIERFPEAYRPPRNIVLRMDRSLFFPNCECFEICLGHSQCQGK